jgi:diguanylate cyclase (GGDEF)-like protein
MRKGRFSALAGRGERTISLRRLLLLDFVAPATEEETRLVRDRASFLIGALPLVACFRLLWGLLLCALLFRETGGIGGWVLPFVLCLVLAADAVLPRLARFNARPAAAARCVAVHAAVTGLLWMGATASVVTAYQGDVPSPVDALIVAGAAVAVPVVFAVPAVLLLVCGATLATAVLLGVDPMMLPVGGGLTVVLTALSLFRAREQAAAAGSRLDLEAQAEKAGRFVADFEASGRGWFWETDPDGALSYASAELARHFAQQPEDLAGRPFAALLPGDKKPGEGSLDFHLSARFPFADAVVEAPSGEGCWSVSGRPNFDGYGRFLGFRGLAINLTARERSEAETSRLARFDSLTGLPNRAAMAAMLEDALSNSSERRQGCALMMIDLDRFKQVNDTLGHPIGDQLLKQVAARLREAIGSEGQVGRLGGDEFQAIFPGIDEQVFLSRVAKAVIDAVSRPCEIEGHRVCVGASVGIALARPGKTYAAALVKEADLALYASKAAGRGTFHFFAPEMHAEAAERQILERDLAEALGRGQLHLLYQPIVETVSEEPVAFEALLRWRHPTRGLLMPDVLIPLATECGLMTRIGAWVLREACAEAARWPAHIRLAVNLSPAEFEDKSLATHVAAALAASGLDPERLELEIGEDVFIAGSPTGEQALASLHELGVRVALDNFGTGHSGLGHLRTVPLDKIKVDRSFVRGAATPRSRNAAIVRAIVVLAEEMGIDTTAEGIETLEELALVRNLGCSQLQGLLFGKPLSAEEARALAASSRPPGEAAAFSRPPRHRLIRTGTLEIHGEHLRVRLRNISEAGAMVECDRPLPPETAVQLDLEEAGRLDAEVRWSGRGQIGMRFAAPFSLSRLARRAGARGAPKVLAPHYLDAPVPAGPSPVLRKGDRAKRRTSAP